MKRIHWIFALLLTSLVWVSCDDDEDDDNNLEGVEQDFVQLAAQSNLYEIQLSELAVDQGRDTLVRAFAQQMVDEHGTAQDELRAIANQYKLAGWPDALSANQQSVFDSLSEAEGFQFDTKFMEAQISLHQNSVGIFEKGAKSNNADVKGYANKYLNAIRMHLQMADSLNSQLPQRWEADQNSGWGDIGG